MSIWVIPRNLTLNWRENAKEWAKIMLHSTLGLYRLYYGKWKYLFNFIRNRKLIRWLPVWQYTVRQSNIVTLLICLPIARKRIMIYIKFPVRLWRYEFVQSSAINVFQAISNALHTRIDFQMNKQTKLLKGAIFNPLSTTYWLAVIHR